MVQQVYLLPTSSVGLPYNLLGYLVTKTVHLWCNHWILHWNPLSSPLFLPHSKFRTSWTRNAKSSASTAWIPQVIVIGWYFDSSFLSISTQLLHFLQSVFDFSYVHLSLYFITLTTRWQRLNMIDIGTLGYLLPTLVVRPPHNLLGYGVPKTVHLWLSHWILRWSPFSGPLLFPPFKVQDFLNSEHKE